MTWKRVLIVTILLLLIVFTAQNYEVAQVKFFAWSFKASTAIVVFCSLIAGFIIGLVVSVPKKV